MARPAVSVVLPFAGDREEAEEALDALAAIDLREGDEVVVVDNSADGVVPEREGVVVVRTAAEHSAYHARNAGVDRARGEWLLFVDADCRPRPGLLAAYFDPPPAEGDGAVVGEVAGDPDQDGLVPRYSRSRGHLTQKMHVEFPFRPFGVTANMLVRRAAWEDVGGFQEGIRSTGDVEISWRLQDAGWTIGYRPEAVVEHAHRESVRALVRQAGRYGAGRAWIHRRYPQGMPLPRIARPLLRTLAGVPVWLVSGQVERARFKALDGVYVAAEWGSSWLDNRPPGARPEGAAARVAIAARWPDREDPDAIAAAAGAERVEALARPVRVDRDVAAQRRAVYAEDDGRLERFAGVVWALTRRPLAAARLLRSGSPPLREVAPAARRLAGATTLVAASPAAEPRARAIAALTGLPLEQPNVRQTRS